MNNIKYIGIYDVLDIACADAVSVDVPLWIDVIESFSFRRMEVVLAHILNGDQKKREQVCRIFHAQLHRVRDSSEKPAGEAEDL